MDIWNCISIEAYFPVRLSTPLKVTKKWGQARMLNFFYLTWSFKVFLFFFLYYIPCCSIEMYYFQAVIIGTSKHEYLLFLQWASQDLTWKLFCNLGRFIVPQVLLFLVTDTSPFGVGEGAFYSCHSHL